MGGGEEACSFVKCHLLGVAWRLLYNYVQNICIFKEFPAFCECEDVLSSFSHKGELCSVDELFYQLSS